MDIGARPAALSGCWSSWVELDIDNVIRTEMDSGALHTRRRFTGTAMRVKVSGTFPANQRDAFRTWFRINQRQGTIPTYVVDPEGNEVVFQWIGTPQISWKDSNAVQVSVTMYQGAWF